MTASDRSSTPITSSDHEACVSLPPFAGHARHDAIYVLLNQGRLRSVKPGRRRLIPISELERFLAEELA
jgi:excisionase family DNA binding protein